MRKVRAFTLIELLAVIVILAVIVVISVPIAINVIEDTEKNAFRNTAYGLIDAMKLKYAENYLHENTDDLLYTFPEATGLSFKGEVPDGGVVRLTGDGKVSLAVYNHKWCALKGMDTGEVTLIEYVEGKCILPEEADVPILSLDGEDIIYLSLGKQYVEAGYRIKTVGGVELSDDFIHVSVLGQNTGKTEVDTSIEEIYTITYTVTYKGNINYKTRIVHVGNYKPTVQIEPNGTNSYQQKEELTIHVSAFEQYSIDGFQYSLVKDGVASEMINVDHLSETITLTEDGIYQVRVIATDSEGNINEYVSDEYKIDTTPPEILFLEDDIDGVIIPLSDVIQYDLMTGVTVDDQSGTVSLDHVEVSGSLSASVGFNTVQYTVMDEAGNKSIKTRKVSVIHDSISDSGLYITEVIYKNDVDADLIHTELQAYDTTLSSDISLAFDNFKSNATFMVTIYNNTNYDYRFTGYQSTLHSNNNIQFSLNGLTVGNVILSKGSVTFEITFQYKSGYSGGMDNQLGSILDFKFDKLIETMDIQSEEGNYNTYVTCTGVQCSQFSSDDFYLSIETMNIPEPAYGVATFTKSYNSSTGVLTFVRSSLTGSGFITYSGKVYANPDAQFIRTVNGTYTVTIDCTSVDDYQNKTVDDFFYVIDFIDAPECEHPDSTEMGVSGTMTFTKTYNASTGKLTINRSSIVGTGVVTMSVSAYYVNK